MEEEHWAARGNRERCCMEEGIGDMRVCGVVIIPFSVQIGTQGGHAPRGASCPLAKKCRNSAWEGPALWNLLFIGLPHLPVLLRGMGFALCKDLSLHPDLASFSVKMTVQKNTSLCQTNIFFGGGHYLSSCLTLNHSELKSMGAHV